VVSNRSVKRRGPGILKFPARFHFEEANFAKLTRAWIERPRSRARTRHTRTPAAADISENEHPTPTIRKDKIPTLDPIPSAA